MRASSSPRRPEPRLEEASEAHLVRRLQAKDAQAAELLYRRHAPALLAKATRLLASPSEAQDVLQETFLIAFAQLPRLRAPEALAGWLRQICLRQVHRRFRRERLLRLLGMRPTREGEGLGELAAPSASPEVRAELSLLGQALCRLGAAARLAWSLRYLEGHTLPEVAELCGCSLATAKRRLQEADLRVRAHVQLEEVADG